MVSEMSPDIIDDLTLQMAEMTVRTSRSGSDSRRQAATLRPRIMMRRMSRGDASTCTAIANLQNVPICQSKRQLECSLHQSSCPQYFKAQA